ncbi:alpha-tocopherol transfer protein-like isoform X1 [Diabrotica virgifera virgifera]|uniref:CRAL-TRIO domain-containing protein n=1 Tax=Diabrotica virgifera virgifera TaxID=50390 RepID=A0ABM5ISX2_DIAVI|nr:alpha-tocopherol transfer protein-like isoform X1 [Diabrotica virgifera virgifera]
MSLNDLLITDRRKIRKVWGKTESDVYKDIEILRKWLQTQKHLPEIPTDNMIEFFLVNCKFSIEKTKKTLDMYYTVPSLVPDVYKNAHPCTSDVESAYATVNIFCIPELTPTLHRLTIFQHKDVDFETADIRRSFAHCLKNFYEIRIHEDLSMGEIYLIDCERIKVGVLAKVTPMLLKQAAFILERVHSLRTHSVHVINAPSYYNQIVTLFKSLAKKKLADRVHVHKSLDELLKHLPLDILPSDFGGKQKSCDELAELWKKKMFEYKDRFDKLEKMQVNEVLRPEKLENDEILGYYGNFKKIDTD